MLARHWERHVNGRIGWLRAAILSANDGILSTASLVLGVAAVHSSHRNILVAGIAGLVAWLCRWLSVSTYRSTHRQAPNRLNLSARVWNSERTTKASTRKLAAIYVARGLDPSLAKQVAMQLMGRACPRRIRHH